MRCLIAKIYCRARLIATLVSPQFPRHVPYFPKVKPHAPNTIQTPAREDLPFWGRVKQGIWALGIKMQDRTVKYAIKSGMAVAALAAPAFFEKTRPLFTYYRGEWALISVSKDAQSKRNGFNDFCHSVLRRNFANYRCCMYTSYSRKHHLTSPTLQTNFLSLHRILGTVSVLDSFSRIVKTNTIVTVSERSPLFALSHF